MSARRSWPNKLCLLGQLRLFCIVLKEKRAVGSKHEAEPFGMKLGLYLVRKSRRGGRLLQIPASHYSQQSRLVTVSHRHTWEKALEDSAEVLPLGPAPTA